MDGMSTDDGFTKEERKWLAVWDERLQAVADGRMTPEDVYAATWREKVLNAINVTRQRIKRAEQPGRDPRREDSTWVTVVAERARTKEDLSLLAFRTFALRLRAAEGTRPRLPRRLDGHRQRRRGHFSSHQVVAGLPGIGPRLQSQTAALPPSDEMGYS